MYNSGCKSQRGDFLRFEAFRTCLKTSGVRNSRIEPINDLARRRWRARFLALAICRSSMTGLGVTPHHRRNGFFMHDQKTTVFPKHIATPTSAMART
jgi:hypothetical protein